MKQGFFGAAVIALILALSLSAHGQEDCYATFTLDNILNIDRDGTVIVSMPVYFSNSCKVGGIELDILTDPFGALEPIGLDTVGSAISYWEYFSIIQDRQNERLRILGVADWPGGEEVEPLDTNSLTIIFNLLLRFGCDYSENVTVDVTFDSVFVVDSSGYEMFDIYVDNATVHIGEDVTPIERGDTNCSGNLIGSDVTYLVSYFRGLTECPCSLCAGDANGDGVIIGSDVTYLVRYFGGLGPPPPPCD